MKVNTYEYPKSSFLGMAKDTALIMDKILGNKKVLKLLYYNTPDWESRPDLNSNQKEEMFKTKQISNVPSLRIDKDDKSYLRIAFDDFTPNGENPFYRDHIVEIRIICHFDSWDLHNYELRPYRIAGEIDSMLNGARLTGIGILNFLGANQDVYDQEFGGVTLRYLAVRGNEDKVNSLE